MPTILSLPRRAPRSRRGFTQQEPWIAIVIVAILAVIAIPSCRTTHADALRLASLRTFVGGVVARQAPRDTLPGGYAGPFPIAILPRSGPPAKSVHAEMTKPDSVFCW